VTGPRQDDGNGFPFTPARRDRPRPGRRPPPAEPVEVDDELADLERGRTAALLGALGRMQLRLDLLAREQREGFAAVQARLDELERGTRPDQPPPSRSTD
jgi:hypothetical protein